MIADGKLVRDGIPRIIRATGAEPVIHIAGPDEYQRRLRDKLGEETAEYLGADSDERAVEELADVLEVVRALAAIHGADPGQLEKVRATKHAVRGGFAERIVWHGNAA